MLEKKLVAVYGSLRKGLHNHGVLANSELLGMFDSDPIYDMYSVCGSYPGILKDGNTSIKMEVYLVNSEVSKNLDQLEGYRPGHEHFNHYNKIEIQTPFGKANTYLYNRTAKGLEKVESGDWFSYKTNKLKEAL
jgi:gamma-glutamylcyclotransferase (GGCT)/AIG2-like uncharacterized protein YtfP